MSLRMTRAGDYAFRAMLYLASLPPGSWALREEIARQQHIPSDFVAKILQRLVEARLLHSCRGISGGFTLARHPSEINMLEIMEAVEGPLSLNRCVPDPRGCELSDSCPAHPVWVKVQAGMSEILSSADLDDLLKEE